MKTLLTATSVPQIPVADKPPLLGGKVTMVGQEEFARQFGCAYAEGVWLDETLPQSELNRAKESIVSDVSPQYFHKQIASVINNPFENIIIGFINEKVGYGVFAKKKIKKGTLVSIYSGEIGSSLDKKSLQGYELQYFGTNFCYKQNKQRGVASFFQHLPKVPQIPDPHMMSKVLAMAGQKISVEALMLDNELYTLKFESPAARSNLATENLNNEYVIYQNIPVICMVANRDIEIGEQLGFSYGADYWLGQRVHPELFDKAGGIIPSSHYQRTYGHLFFNQFTYAGDFTPLIRDMQTKKTLMLQTNKGTQEVPSEEIKQVLIRARALKDVAVVQSPLLAKWKTNDIHQALRRAAVEGTPADIELLLSEKQADLNSKDTNPAKNYTALHNAVIKGKELNVQYLLSRGARYDIADASGKNAFDYAQSESMRSLMPGYIKPNTKNLANDI